MKLSDNDILKIAQAVFDNEIQSIEASRKHLGDGFIKAAKSILHCNGKIVTMGIGKSGVVARKVAATLASTGTTSVFVHPVECLHGDMGIINATDIAIILSKSGESDEIRKIMLFLQNRGIQVIGVTERVDSHLGQTADIVIPMDIPSEACPMGLAPMASSTVQMIIGDALASVLIQMHDFKPEDFALFHPAGTLGKKLLLKVADLMHYGDENPVVQSQTNMREALVPMTEKAMGAILIVDTKTVLIGILTDGDLRRALQQHPRVMEMTVDEIMTRDPISVNSDQKAIDALHLMEKRPSQISVLPVVDVAGKPVGILRLHDLILAGL
jgi:arabinose-5-phosphate isomerase